MRINIYIPNEKRIKESEIQKVVSISAKYGITKKESGGVRSGSTDIILIIQFVLIWGSLEALKAYGKGFFGVDWFKQAGENLRKGVNDDLIALRKFFSELYEKYIAKNTNELGAISINDSTENFEIQVVLNLSFVNEEMILNLAEDLLRAKLFLTNSSNEINHNYTVQLLPNRKNNRWDYILIPTVQAFGHYVDQYYNFEDQKIHILNSNKDFRDTFGIGEDEKYKMLISPSQNRNFDDVGNI